MREKERYKIEVHVAGIVFDNDKVFVLKRSPARRLYPDLWECGGGQVNPGENFEEAIVRQLREEAGIECKPIGILETYEILAPDLDQKKIPGIRFVCEFLGYTYGEEPKISEEHTEGKWISIDEADELEFIPGLKEKIREAYHLYKVYKEGKK